MLAHGECVLIPCFEDRLFSQRYSGHFEKALPKRNGLFTTSEKSPLCINLLSRKNRLAWHLSYRTKTSHELYLPIIPQKGSAHSSIVCLFFDRWIDSDRLPAFASPGIAHLPDN